MLMEEAKHAKDVLAMQLVMTLVTTGDQESAAFHLTRLLHGIAQRAHVFYHQLMLNIRLMQIANGQPLFRATEAMKGFRHCCETLLPQHQ